MAATTSFHEKSLKLLHFKLDRDEIWRDCSSSNYTLIDRFRFLIRHHLSSRWRRWRHGHDVISHLSTTHCCICSSEFIFFVQLIRRVLLFVAVIGENNRTLTLTLFLTLNLTVNVTLSLTYLLSFLSTQNCITSLIHLFDE